MGWLCNIGFNSNAQKSAIRSNQRLANMRIDEERLAARRPYWEARTYRIDDLYKSEAWQADEIRLCMEAPRDAVVKYASQVYSDDVGALCQLAIARMMEHDPDGAIDTANKFGSFIIGQDLWLGIGKSVETKGIEEMRRLWKSENALPGRSAFGVAWVESSPEATWSILTESIQNGGVSTAELMTIWSQHARRDLASATYFLGALPEGKGANELWRSAWLGLANDSAQLNQAAIEVSKWTNTAAAAVALEVLANRLKHNN